jgi:hypothetical protein
MKTSVPADAVIARSHRRANARVAFAPDDDRKCNPLRDDNASVIIEA